MAETISYFRRMIDDHHAAMRVANTDDVMLLREEARKLAFSVNGNDSGILASDGAPGCVLERETTAAPCRIPLWGQLGEFKTTVCEVRVRIEMNDMLGIGASCTYWHAFAAHVGDFDAPLIRGTGYRSFLGIHAVCVPDLMPDAFVSSVIDTHIVGELGGKLEMVVECYHQRNG